MTSTTEELRETPYDAHVIVTARCCRAWPVLALLPLGRCGICGERPVLTGETWEVGA
jgi:hypothetical protein